MGSGDSKIVKGLDHDVNNKIDEIILDKCDFLTCPPEEYFTNMRNKINKNQLLFIIILLILLIYFILVYNMKYI